MLPHSPRTAAPFLLMLDVPIVYSSDDLMILVKVMISEMKYQELCKVKHKSRTWLYDVALLFELNPLSVSLSVWFLLVSEQVDISSRKFFFFKSLTFRIVVC